MRESEIYRLSKERLRGRWCKQRLHDGAGNVCAVGAVILGGKGSAQVFRARAGKFLPSEFIGEVAPHFAYVECFNDHPGTTEADVLGLFDKVIADAERDEIIDEAREIVTAEREKECVIA